MAKRLNVSLAMTADSSQAKAELNKLQLQLDHLMKSATKSSSLGLTKDIREGVDAAAKLKVMFQQATDEAGKLNLDKFNTALKSSGQSLSKYADKLIAMGPEGSKAFSQIARSIMNAEIPLKRTNAMLSEFATTLKNTVRWQISSSVLHGFMGSLQSAYGYAQNLDESLNNIRIVTNKSTDEMAKFAIEANKSAQALSTTTTRYTEAALIFYQQGLEGKDVTDRTDTVIKMANVTGEAAKDVSSYMTAIWNNFDDGSQSIEHYADVLTALGAATASSTAEISAGLEKFASIADVTGLSYDYATSALATLIANTRQSADVVGTSLKTIFSRIEGLKFGETLEDGVDLNKYSEALAKIGVNVLDVTGNLKDLDDILDDTAERWGTLSRAQQMATAQTVAGVRQYNNFISLMDNWDDMEDNLQTAKTSDGTLQDQADIYAESWEAARNRVRAAAEEIYNALLDEKFFISLLNTFEKILNTVKNTIDGLGGLPGVLTWIAAAMLQAFGPQISKQISDTWYNLTYSTEKAEADLEKLRKSVINTMQSFSGFDNYSTTMADVFRITSEAQDAFLIKNQELQAKGLEMDALAKQEIQTRLSQVDTMGEEISKIAEKRQAEEEEINTLKQRMAIEAGQKSYDTNIKSQVESLQHLSQANSILTKRVLEFKGAMDSLKKSGWTSLKETMLPSIQALQDSFKDLDTQGNKSLEDVKEALMKLPTAAKTTKSEMKAALDTLWDSLDVLTQDSQKLANSLRETFKSPQDAKALNDLLDQMISHFSTLGNLTDEESQKLENLKKIQGELKEQIKNAQAESITFATGLVTLAQSLSSIAMAVQSIKSLGSIWNDDDKTTSEKILATMTTMGMIIPILTRTLSEQNLVKLSGLAIDRKANKAKLTENTLSILSTTLKKNEGKSSLANAAAKALEKKVTDAGTASLWSYIAAQMVANRYYAAIVAVILILVGVVAALTKAWNADAEAAKKAAEAAEAASDAADEAREAYEALAESFKAYDEAVDKLGELTEGTEEYAETLKEANKYAMELIHANSDLAKYAHRGANGLIEFDEEGRGAVLTAANQRMNSAAAAADIAQIDANNAQLKSNRTNAIRQEHMGYLVSNSQGDRWVSLSDTQLQAIIASVQENGSLLEEDLRSIDSLHNNEELINSVMNAEDKIMQLTEATDNLNATNKLLLDDATRNSLENNEEYAELSEAEKNAFATLFQEDVIDENAIEAEKKKIHDEIWQDAAFGGGNEDDIHDQYAKAMGYTLNKDMAGDKASYIKANGDTVEIDDDAARRYLEQMRIAELMGAKTEENAARWDKTMSALKKVSEQATKAGEEYGADFSSAVMNAAANGGKELDLKNTFKDIDLDEYGELSNKSTDEIMKMFGFSEEDLKTLGFTSAQDFAEQFQDALLDYDIAGGFLNKQAQEVAKNDALTNAMSSLAKDGKIDDETFTQLKELLGDSFDEAAFNVATTAEKMNMLQEATRGQVHTMRDLYDLSQDLDLAARNQEIEKTNNQIEELKKKEAELLEGGISGESEAKELMAVRESLNELEQQLEDLTSGDYELDVNVNIEDTLLDQFALEVEGIISQADLLQKAAEAIGESFQVASDDVSLLADAFPEILENAQVLADGTVQLDEEVCKRVMENNSLIVSSDTEATGTQLENKLALLDAEISYEKHKAQLLQDYLNGVIDESQLEDGIKKAGAEFEQDLREAGLHDQANALSEMFANQSASTKSALDLLNQIDAKIQQVSENYSKMLSGKVVNAVETQMTGSGPALSSKYTQTNVGELDNTKNKNYEEYKAQYEATLARIAELENARGDYTELLAKLRKEAEETKKAVDGAASGKGGLQKEDKGSGKTEKQKDPEFINYKKLSDVVERYHEIEEALEDINRELEKIDKTESRTYGKGRMSALKSKIDGYKNEAAALERYAAEAEKYLKEDSAKASQAGWKFDSSGNVSNYEENLRSITEKYNQTIAAYNAMTAEQQEEYKKQLNGEGKNPLQQAEKEYKNALDALKQYEETADKYEDIQDKILENRRNIADAQLEEIELTVELNLEVDERNIALLEELFENMGDSADYVVDKIENIEKRIDAVVGKVETARKAMKDTFDLLGEYNDNIDGGMLERMLTGNMTPEDLQNIADAVSNSDGVLNYDEIMSNTKDYADNLMDYNQELRDLRASVYDELENAMDKYSEEFDKVDDKIAHSKKMLSGYKDIVSALGKANVDPTGVLTRRLNENTIKTNESDWRAANARQEAMKKSVADAEEGLRKAKASGSEYDIQRWTAILEKAQKDLTDAEENSQDKLVEWIESIGEAFKAEIEQVIEDLDKELGGLSDLRENFDRQQTLNEQYVDDYEKIYQLSKMTRDINKTIDETDSVSAKKALMEFQQKINKYQEDGVQMSQYEVENLQRQLELEKAKIELDEAKDAKSQVRMQRDAEGNYGYVYTANETDVAAAEQNYEDKLHEIQAANGSYINELQDSIITMQEECSARIKEIMLDESLSMEERMAKVEETRDYYQKRLEYYSGQLGIVLDNNKELYENEWLEYSERTGYKISRNEDYVDSWQETSLGILTETENQETYMARVQEAIDNATGRMSEAMEDYQERTSDAMEQAGFDVDNLAEDIGQRADEVTEDSQNAADEAERLEEEYEGHLGNAMTATQDFTENYGQAIQDCIDENIRIINSINDVITALANMASAANSTYQNIHIPDLPGGGGNDTPGAGGGPGSGSSEGDSGNSGGDKIPQKSGKTPPPAPRWGIKGYDNSGHTNIWITHGNGGKGWPSQAEAEKHFADFEDDVRNGKIGGLFAASFDTGGYTGNWGTSAGKIAMLHQKELVLNATDTSNMLDMVSIVRDISRMIDMNALSSMITSGLTAATVNASKGDVLEQHVEITAEFRDATTAEEITDAFENLINRATQFANRK